MVIRLIGIVFVALGAALTYFTYSAAAQAAIVPQIVPVFYVGSGLLMLVGFIAVIARLQ